MKYLLLVVALLTVAATANAQTFYGGGLSFGSTVGDGFNGQNGSIGAFGEGTFSKKLGLRFDANGIATIDHAPKDGTTGGVDYRLRPEIRAFAPLPGRIAPFVGGGVQFAHFSSDQYSKSGLNYTASAGVEIYGAHTARFQRLFTDRTKLNGNRLEGFRYGYDLSHKFSGKDWGIRFSAEYNRFKYIQPIGFINAGSYDGQSLAFRLGVAKF